MRHDVDRMCTRSIFLPSVAYLVDIMHHLHHLKKELKPAPAVSEVNGGAGSLTGDVTSSDDAAIERKSDEDIQPKSVKKPKKLMDSGEASGGGLPNASHATLLQKGPGLHHLSSSRKTRLIRTFRGTRTVLKVACFSGWAPRIADWRPSDGLPMPLSESLKRSL